MTGIYEGVEKRNERGITVKGHCARETVEKFARNDVIKLSYQVDVAEEGWIENLKRILQVLWKIGWIDRTSSNDYIIKGYASQMKKVRK